MSGPHLPDNFAMQSKMPEQPAETVTSIFPIDGDRGMAIVIEMSRAAPTSLRIDGLLPRRFYLLEGVGTRFARADESGTILLVLTIDGRALLSLRPLI
ncbi:hypothetical protein [Sphingomonas lycopersici]|uniref:Uncharacterized protein n=1 Tax=Sphingomonas lycopersici TaxID=2951807 RepID=A0AA41Z9F6_9SPHN|nr:hypothetical protein [Sphingomonas lycopersici]MCW6535424.1 hypothetical protein [Sphingomonas lycopersici]